MDAEIVVVGAGIGGLTVAALLAQRGMNVCVLERESTVGGCASNFEKFGYSFERGYGLYTGWQSGEIHDRIFSELPVVAPRVRPLEPSYTVTLPDQTTVSLGGNWEQFQQDLRGAFPECAEDVVTLYEKAMSVRSHKPTRSSAGQPMAEHLEGISPRFTRFVDAQLQILAQTDSRQVSYEDAAQILSIPLGRMFAIGGGAAALAAALEQAIKKTGGRVRLNSPALKLGYDTQGNATGVVLLNGETVGASKAIVSNLTIWDTYGKLVGLNKTPSELRQKIKTLRSYGAYFVYLGIDEEVALSLSSSQLVVTNDSSDVRSFNPEDDQLFVALAPQWDRRAPDGKRAVTVHTFTDVDDWFTFHTDETEHEAQDQRMLEGVWKRLAAAFPATVANAEVIDTETPRTFYELTRRKLGMVGGLSTTPGDFRQGQPRYQTSLANLFLISDTTSGGSIAELSEAAVSLADFLTQA